MLVKQSLLPTSSSPFRIILQAFVVERLFIVVLILVTEEEEVEDECLVVVEEELRIINRIKRRDVIRSDVILKFEDAATFGHLLSLRPNIDQSCSVISFANVAYLLISFIQDITTINTILEEHNDRLYLASIIMIVSSQITRSHRSAIVARFVDAVAVPSVSSVRRKSPGVAQTVVEFTS